MKGRVRIELEWIDDKVERCNEMAMVGEVEVRGGEGEGQVYVYIAGAGNRRGGGIPLGKPGCKELGAGRKGPGRNVQLAVQSSFLLTSFTRPAVTTPRRGPERRGAAASRGF